MRAICIFMHVYRRHDDADVSAGCDRATRCSPLPAAKLSLTARRCGCRVVLFPLPSSLPGGFASYSYHRYIPKKGFTGLTALGLVSFSVIGGFARWVHCQRIENEKRIARQQERGEFLKKLDVHLHKKSVCMGTHDASTRGMDGWRRGVTGSACIRPAPTSAHHCNSAPLRLLGNCECVFVPGSLRMCSDRPSWTCWPWTRCSRQRPSTKRRSMRRIFPVILFPLLPLFTLRLFSLANACSSTVLYAHATTHNSKQRNRRPSVLHPCAGEFVVRIYMRSFAASPIHCSIVSRSRHSTHYHTQNQ